MNNDSIRVTEMQGMLAPPGKFIPVYITAKLIHAKMLVDTRSNWPNLFFTARWPLTAQLPSEQAKPATLWTQDNETDMVAARVVVGYSHEDESTPLRDPLWELGEAHAHRKPIYLAGPIERFGKYAHCSSVVGRYSNLGSALMVVSHLNDYESHSDKILGALTHMRDLLEEMRDDQRKAT
jgi:hypothetical protein